MKYVIYFVTLIAYMSVHIMRMGLPFVQLQLMYFFGIRKFDVGIANAGLYIIIAISYLWRTLYGVRNPQFTYLWSMIISGLSFLIIPLLVFINAKIIPLFYVSLVGFGWFQTAAWPILLFLIHAYFHPKESGCVLGFWSAAGDIGNITGFFLCSLIIFNLQLPFQWCLMIGGIFAIILAVLVFSLKIDISQHEIEQANPEGYTRRICGELKTIIKDPIVVLTILLLSLLKSILYGLLLWLPMYFEQSGFKEFEAYIPIGMNLMAIFGSVALGFVFQQITSKAVKATIFMCTLVITVVCFFLVRQVQFTLENRFILLALIGIIGFCIMGNFNILSAHEITSIAEKHDIFITALSSFAMFFGNLFVGILQFIIGYFATDDSNSVFVIFFIISLIVILIEIIRVIFLWRNKIKNNRHEDEMEKENHQKNELFENDDDNDDEVPK